MQLIFFLMNMLFFQTIFAMDQQKNYSDFSKISDGLEISIRLERYNLNYFFGPHEFTFEQCKKKRLENYSRNLEQIRFLMQHQDVFTSNLLSEKFYKQLVDDIYSGKKGNDHLLKIISEVAQTAKDPFNVLLQMSTPELCMFSEIGRALIEKIGMLGTICFGMKPDVIKSLVYRQKEHSEEEKLLIEACEKGNIEIATKLLEKDRKRALLCVENQYPLIYIALFRGHLQIMKLLYEYGASLKSICIHYPEDNLVQHASKKGRFDIVNWLKSKE